MSEIPLDLQTTEVDGVECFRIVAGGVASPNLRSAKAAEIFVLDGSFQQMFQGLTDVTRVANEMARRINALSDKQLDERYQELREPKIILPS